METAQLIESFNQAGQGHVFRFWNELSAAEQAQLAAQAAEIDLAEIARLNDTLVRSNTGAAVDLTDLEPAPYVPLPANGGDAAEWAEARRIGEDALRAGRVAAFVVAGGQGTRLGYDGPKGTFKVTPVLQKSLFQVFAEKILAAGRRYGKPLHWFIMTSHANHAATEAFFVENGFFGLGADRVHFFRQGRMPAVDFEGKIILETKSSIAMSPDGHGGSLRALDRSGALEIMRREGIDVLSYFQVDNPLVRCVDPTFIGFHLRAGAEMSSKMIPKAYPEEKVGHFCRQRGKLLVVEYSDLPMERQREVDPANGRLRFIAGSVAIHIFSRAFIERMAKGDEALPFHRANKKIPCIAADGTPVKPEKANGVKFEMFVFDALPFAKNAVTIEAPRADDFSPVKNADGVDSPKTCRDDQLRQFARWLRAAGAELPVDATGLPPFAVEVSPLFGDDEPSFRAAWAALKAKPAVAAGLVLGDPSVSPRTTKTQITMSTIDQIAAAEQAGLILPSTAQNLRTWLGGTFLPDWGRAAIEELVAKEQWSELNDRFYRTLEFGTGGMRGRTIGKATAAAEIGTPSEQGTPAHPAVGCNVLNDFTVVRATIGLFRYTRAALCAAGSYDIPRFVIAHDVRHFSRHFCELAASTWAKLGGQAFIFDGPRSTPQLSFSVRYLKASCGVVITASHNPPHDNGYKVYFSDGGQVVSPHDTGIIAEVEKVAWDEVAKFFEKSFDGVVTLAATADQAYLDSIASALTDPKVFKGSKLKVVFTNVHGTGAVAALPLLKRFGVKVTPVEAQLGFDPRFPTVKSPNPENAPTLAMGVELAKKIKADVVLATDPDADRMGVAVRNDKGEMELITGNQIGALLAESRISALKKSGVLPKKGTKSAALIKTFVTSQLQDAIGAAHGIKVINTLTGFKWIGNKLADYEAELKAKMMSELGIALDYDATDAATRAELLLKYSTLYVFGGEESYGYLATDTVRDKDANSACLVFCELAANAKKAGKSIASYLDGLYLKYGYYTEAVGNIYYEGAAGAAKIAKILASYRKSPPKAFGKLKVTKFRDFGREKIKDADGKPIPAQDLYIVELANGFNYAVRGSGTEPKIKFYLFGKAKVKSAKALPETKAATKAALEELRQQIEADAAQRAER